MARRKIRLTVNGRGYQVEVEPTQTLVDVLRETLGLTGTKVNCRMGECGACTVILDGRTVHACLTLAPHAAGRKIVTIEGLASGGELHPLQRAFIEHYGFQCGFCTPGMILSAKALLDENPHPTPAEIKRAIAGNLCRCTGYHQIIEAIEACANAAR
ncbi:MAG: (2Fe-2S)-binding protein [Deltaproteobacteria bacterium]|nr:(2Fe-2S)-binding protein [Deltaproteobacteria bacterium]